jgi:hypothetical protein
LVAAVLVAVAALTPVGAPAQEATPPPGASAPGPEECRVSPPAPETILAVLATPAADPEGSAPGVPASGGQLTVASEDEFPTGESADAATAAAAAAVANEFAACLNARDVFRLFSLLSDDLLRTLGAEVGLELESPADWATAAATQPTPVPKDARLLILEIRDARVLPDGRVGVVQVQDVLDDDQGPKSSLVVLVETEGRWLVDAVVLVDPEAAEP